MTVSVASVISPQTREASRFLRTLHRELSAVLVPEMELTMRVAVMSAAGLSRQTIVRQLGASDIEVRAALERLKKIADAWR